MKYGQEPIDPRIDIVFKRVFGSEGHAEVPKSFLNAIFRVAGIPAVRELSIQNPFRPAEFRGEKDMELDILYLDEAGRQVQLEMQVAYHVGLEQRMLHNWSQLYVRQLDKGGHYRDHRPVVSLWVLERPLWDDGEWLHVMRPACERSGHVLHDDFCIVVIELGAWRRLMLARHGDMIIDEGEEQAWLFFLAQGHALCPERLGAVLHDPVFSEAVQLMANFSILKKWRHYYDMRRNYAYIVASYKETGYEEGLREGRDEGREEGREEGQLVALRSTARRMAAEGLPNETIARLLGIDETKLEALRGTNEAPL